MPWLTYFYRPLSVIARAPRGSKHLRPHLHCVLKPIPKFIIQNNYRYTSNVIAIYASLPFVRTYMYAKLLCILQLMVICLFCYYWFTNFLPSDVHHVSYENCTFFMPINVCQSCCVGLRNAWLMKAMMEGHLAVLSPNSTCCVTSRHDTHDVTCVSRRACSNIAGDEEAVVLACTSLVFRALDLHQSQEQLLEKWGGHVHPSPTVATPLNICGVSHACRTCPDERVAPCCPTSATQHVTTFSCAKMHVVSCRDVTQQVEFGLYCCGRKLWDAIRRPVLIHNMWAYVCYLRGTTWCCEHQQSCVFRRTSLERLIDLRNTDNHWPVNKLIGLSCPQNWNKTEIKQK